MWSHEKKGMTQSIHI